jgi:hypothetical protein
LKSLIAETNGHLEQQNLKISNTTVAVDYLSTIESLDALNRRAIDIKDNGDVTPTAASKD